MKFMDLPFDEVIKEIKTIEQLLDLPDQQFIRAAYICVLNREPDDYGSGTYRWQLARGEPKISIIDQLIHSEEGRARRLNLVDLKGALNRFRVRDGSLINRWRFRGNAETGRSPAMRAARAVTHQIERLEELIDLRTTELDAKIAEIEAATDIAAHAGSASASHGADRYIPFSHPLPQGLRAVREIDLPDRRAPGMRHLRI